MVRLQDRAVRADTDAPVPSRASVHPFLVRVEGAGRPEHRLAAIADELLALADRLGSRAIAPEAHPANGRAGTSPSPFAQAGDAEWLRLARRTYRNRRSRAALFGDDGLFGEPAWDLLLDLFIAAAEGKRVPVTSACIGAAVPTTTALRWLTVLDDKGLVLREADPEDARRIFVRLTDDARDRMIAYFKRAASLENDEAPIALRPHR